MRLGWTLWLEAPRRAAPRRGESANVAPRFAAGWSGPVSTRCCPAWAPLGSSTSVAAPAASRCGWPRRVTRCWWSSPAPTLWRRWAVEPTNAGSGSGSWRSKATSPTCNGCGKATRGSSPRAPLPSRADTARSRRVQSRTAQLRSAQLLSAQLRSAPPRTAGPIWCSATAYWRWLPTRPRHWPRSAGCCALAACCPCSWLSVTPPSSPGRWPATSSRPGHCSISPKPGAVRVFADLVPGSLLDSEPGAAHALAELEHEVSGRPEFVPLAAQLHVLARC